MRWEGVQFNKLAENSLFDREFDYLISLGHRCCVAQGEGYQRKSSFPFDWQITKINLLPHLFETEFKNFYPDSGVHFAHEYHKEDEDGKPIGVDRELTKEIFERRSDRLVKLLKDNNRRLLFTRHKYIWYWAKLNHWLQVDANPVEYDIEQLSLVSDIVKNQYGNDKAEFLYIYQDINQLMRFDRDPARTHDDIKWRSDGTINPEDLVMLSIAEQQKLAAQFKYTEQSGPENITKVLVEPDGVHVEGLNFNSIIFSKLNITDVQDFKLKTY